MSKTLCTVFVFCALAAMTLRAQTPIFTFNFSDGAFPDAPLIQTNGDYFSGTTYGGGILDPAHCPANGCGTIFNVSGAAFNQVYSFCSLPGCADGNRPASGLIQSTNGDLYGTTYYGGASGSGTIFKFTTEGTLTTLFSFCSLCGDGFNPYGVLFQDLAGNLYGTTQHGGANQRGTFFKLSLAGTLTTLYSFCSKPACSDGYDPLGVIQGRDGNFYGTTQSGGSKAQLVTGSGTVFRLSPQGQLTTLYHFCALPGCADGSVPYAGLVQSTDGSFYGTTSGGGANQSGAIFQISPTGSFTTLYSFCALSGCPDGMTPDSALIQANDGNLYGTVPFGGPYGAGSVFKLTPAGMFTTLYGFCPETGCADGANPKAALTQATDGMLLGTTYGGGSGDGTVFELSIRAGVFVEPRPSYGRVGDVIDILGNAFGGNYGAMSVTFNGTPALFSVKSTVFLTAVVPAGATSGTIQVVTTGDEGTISSNVPFRVVP